MFGWVVVLATGQRLYLEMEVANAEGDNPRPTDLEITALLEHQRYPDELENAVA